MLSLGQKAPPYTLPSTGGGNVALDDLAGRKAVLYFYPKDNTSGCTTEACDFRDNFARIEATGAVVYGVSADSIASHLKFREKRGLTFDLLSDESRTMLETWGVWKEKKLYGRMYMGIERTTVILDEHGIVTHVFPNVKVRGHVDAVLEALES